MGCSGSKQADAAVGGSMIGGPEDEPMTHAEIESRIESSEKTHNVVLGGMKIRYAYLSQRGYYPDDPNKPNQDAFSISNNFCDQDNDAYFAVYDGHGRDGDKCAQFSKETLPKLVEKFVSRTKNKAKLHDGSAVNAELTKEQIQNSCHKAHVECNRAMHKAQYIEDSLSGTTAISTFIHGRRNRITVCNVGDSRAILGKKSGSKETSKGSSNLKAMPLSRDQTPYRRDERIRVKATGARILSLDQIEGLEPIRPDDEGDDLELGEELDEGGDPPRVWSPHGEYPGTAFTRSLGDSIAEELGVIAEPEMLTREITPEDKIIVLASDGVFEFLTNQSVIDICAKFSDPLAACRAVVAESYELWLQYELRTDDITMICIFIDDVDTRSPSVRNLAAATENLPPGGQEGAPADVEDPMLACGGAKPVKNFISKEKSRALEEMKKKMINEPDPSVDQFDKNLFTEKTTEEKGRIAEAIRASVMFQNITDEQREMIYGFMEPINVKKGSWVIKQGTVGDRFYIVDNGKFEVRIVPDGEKDDGSGGNMVHVYEGSHEKHAHPSFGELALMYSAPRAASIIAKTDGNLWALHRYAFRQVLAQQSSRQELLATLKKIEILKNLKPEVQDQLAAVMEEVTFGRGETITEQGSSGDAMYVIQKGSCEYLVRVEGRSHNEALKSGSFFGEEVLGKATKYTATVVALQTTSCFRLNLHTLDQITGEKST
mmetsp:Transcript_21896/g.33122  ORF Transcript_21896/g.33122 Transcript_21896/m.33122 type:complete len:716 (+) Transcript_21896:90-2237(+)|eukprot:CAMPEP_0178918448 /NCGR_PEP_ID=MMETSP0786-20121207/13836_1 /TAXON_ID=186022 /ORGANISM="Thalassionema frauenfeldii, Strain CCMP 1798" /LENGTH=715 /DNA_ID=CAMNT_0020592167 /DNA_START=59 /DNA_END=2206 /DNA_ORIENTATION=-